MRVQPAFLRHNTLDGLRRRCRPRPFWISSALSPLLFFICLTDPLFHHVHTVAQGLCVHFASGCRFDIAEHQRKGRLNMPTDDTIIVRIAVQVKQSDLLRLLHGASTKVSIVGRGLHLELLALPQRRRLTIQMHGYSV